ncbi:MAG: hypothetical protein KF729_00870 [Sandaracinaceae bacterium]|nr:hypothetical protein [Sandaracinaceae bacterium]
MTRLPLLVLTLVGLALPCAARADAIMPFDGECFPGSRRGISGHAEACIPIACASDAECGDGARCATLCVCRAEREVQEHRFEPEPVRRVVEIGLCDGSGGCAEGEVASRRQCEPVEDTPAFDRTSRRWTAVSHPGGAGARRDGTGGAPREGPGANGGSCAGCAVPARQGGGPLALGFAGAVGLVARRRSRR